MTVRPAKTFVFFIIVFGVFPYLSLFAQQKSLDDLLEMGITELMEVRVITPSKTPQKINETPAVVRIITAEQIRENGYTTMDEALAGLPGFQFRDMLSLNSYIFQRGIPNQNNLMLVLIDGVNINELNSGGFYGGAQYNLANVDRIEVVYGPASALYGTNAISGIINIISKNPKEYKEPIVNVLYGSFNTFNADVAYGYMNEKNDFGFRLSAMYKTSEKADLGGKEGDYNWTDAIDNFERDYSFDARLIYKNITAGVDFQNKQISAATYRRSVETIYRDRETFWNILFINGFVKHTHSIAEKNSLSSQVYYRNSTVLDNSVQEVTDTAQIGYYRPNYLLGFESTLYSELHDKFYLTGGFVFEYEELADDYSKTVSGSPSEKPPKPAKPKMDANTLFSFYLQGNLKSFSRIQLTAGARYDNSSVYDQVITPRAALIYNHERLTVKLLYMQAFRAPKPWDYTWGTGNDQLDPEKMTSNELFTEVKISDHMSAEASVYRNHVFDVLALDIDKNKWVNQGELNTNGMEFTVNYKIEKLNIYANYTYNNSQYDNDSKVPEIAEHGINGGLRYAFTNSFILNLRANYLGKRKNYDQIYQATGIKYIDPAFLIHSTLSLFDYHHFDFQIIVKNLLDARYYHTSNRTDPSYLVSRFRQPQRTVLLKTGYRF
ncbi:MAG: TonB-dependent receptor plug domain-containing protein [Calditrichaceae bacterium]|nr:TonB-dependent receptor plug domain-containing protein [Calditrichaceae bacterium]MBN2710291.1 TonB-dependent receptor plug domain-containing protein [Calditrichaceae bacterium]RQV92995.1 MAG: hypothetical protein EH224_13595 [Calditrichota bacterium]